MLKEGEVRIPSGCAIAAVISKEGKRMTGEAIINSMKPMHDRSNGLGGGFAAYGIYPEYCEQYALHVFFDDKISRNECEIYFKDMFEVVNAEIIPTRTMPEITDEPLIYRYFVSPLQSNMGAFKAVGFPEDVGRFYKLDEYEAYSWTAHGRDPTNTPGWWGGAHPFGLLDYTVVHNGEISSYDANRRFIEMFGYRCNLQTDTEVITYIADYLIRRQGLTLEETASVIAAPFWSTIERKPKSEREKLTYLRTVFSSLLVTGPFSIVLAFDGGLMALNDRLKLRSMVVGEYEDKVYIASEEAAIRAMEPNVNKVYAPMGGEPVIVKVKGGQF